MDYAKKNLWIISKYAGIIEIIINYVFIWISLKKSMKIQNHRNDNPKWVKSNVNNK